MTALTRDVKRLVETGRELGEEGRRQREELRNAEFIKRELSDKVQLLEAEVARLRENMTTSHSSQFSETARTELESKYIDSESRRQSLEVDMKLAHAERQRLRQEVERLARELNEERMSVNRLQQDLELLNLRSTGSFIGSPARERGGRDSDARLRESEDRVRQLQDELEAVRMRPGSEHNTASLRQEVGQLRQDLHASERSRRSLEEQLNAQQQQHVRSVRNDDADVERYGSGDDALFAEGTESGKVEELRKVCHERNVRIRQLLKEKAECHAQVRQLSAEVVGLTEALELVTKRAKDKDVRHTELQAKMEKIVRLAGLVDPLLALDARAGPMLVGPRKKKFKSKTTSKSARQPSPIYSRAEHSLTPPRPRPDGLTTNQLARMEAWQDALSMQPTRHESPILNAAPPSRPYGMQIGGRLRPQSARARIQDWEQDQSSAGMAPFEARQEYYPQRVSQQRPLSSPSRRPAVGEKDWVSNASSDYSNMPPALAPYPPANPPRARPPPMDVRGLNSATSSYRPSPAVRTVSDEDRQDRDRDAAHYPPQTQGFVGNMRPFSFLVKCVKEGSVTAQTELRIVIEYCNSEHYSRRHDIGRYQQIYDRVTASLRENLRGRYFTITCNKDSGNRNAIDVEPRAGSFEIYVEWSDAKAGVVNAVVLFSKLESMRYPNPGNVAARLRAVLNGGEEMSDVGTLFGESDA